MSNVADVRCASCSPRVSWLPPRSALFVLSKCELYGFLFVCGLRSVAASPRPFSPSLPTLFCPFSPALLLSCSPLSGHTPGA
eukprot:12895456-Prorocentrum_lima.AAC.1